MRHLLFVLGIIGLVTVCGGKGWAQRAAGDTSASSKTLHIITAERLNTGKKDSAELLSAAGHVIAQHGNTLFYCDSVIQDVTHNMLEAFGHVHINDNDSVHTYSDYLKYLGKDKQAYLKKNVKLTDGKGVLTTDDLSYNLNTKIGIYTNGGKLVNNKSVLTSKDGYYYGQTRDVHFKKNVVLVDPEYTIKTDTLYYNTYTNIATFTVPTEIVGKNQRILTSDGYYDMQKKKSYFGKRSQLTSDSTTLVADDIMNEDSTGYGEAQGNVFIRDLKNGFTLIANNVKSNRKENSFLATQQPVLIMKQDKDSIFIAADTFYSARLTALRKYRNVPPVPDSVVVPVDIKNPQDSSRDRFIEGYYHVRIYSDSLQAVGDSLFYSAEDSVFRLFKNPVVWAQENQITGDTIYLYTLNKKPKRMYVFENALLLNKVGKDIYYNQVKGRTINGYFKDGNINYMRAKGNAENVYYAVDDDNKYVGVNKSKSDAIDLFFVNKKPERVKLINGVEGTMYPMGQVDHDEIKLRGFKWLDDRRPKSRYDLFGG